MPAGGAALTCANPNHLSICCLLLIVVSAMACSCASGKASPGEYYFNPLKCPLPKAPSMQMFCLYGTSKPTERSYYYLNLESNKACRPPSCPKTVSVAQSCHFEDEQCRELQVCLVMSAVA